jgi:hypothetical protein
VRPATPTNARLLWPRPALVAVIVAAVGAEAGTRIWFEWHERIGRPPGVSWRLELPAQGWEEVPIPPRTTQMLGYSEARQFHWRKPADGARGVAFVARWNHDPSAVAVSEGHDPTICLPAAGLRLDAELGRRVVAVEGREISFQALRFRNRAGPVWIWFCVWDGQRAAPLAAEDRAQPDLLRQRLHRLRHGLRRLEIAHVTFTAQGMADDESAEVHLRTAIAETLRRVQ